MFDQPIQHNGKYKFVPFDSNPDGNPDGGFPVAGFVPQYCQDQSTNSWDLNIQISNQEGEGGGEESITTNIATLQIDDQVIRKVQEEEHGTLALPDRIYNGLCLFDTNGKNYATALEIYLGDINLQVQLDEQLQPITQNGTYEIKDMDEDPELEIDGPLPNQQINNRKKTIVKRDDDGNGSKAVANLGQFTVNVQPNLINDYVFRSNGDYDANTIGGYQGFGPRVKVEIDQDLPDIPLIQNDKSFTLNDSGIFTVQPDNGYDGIGQVIVNNNAVDSNIIFQLNTDNANETFTDPNTGRVQLEHSINPSSGNYAMKNVSVYTETQNKEVFVNNNGTITIQPDQGYVGLNQVTINTTVSFKLYFFFLFSKTKNFIYFI